MQSKDVIAAAEEYLEKNWPAMRADLERLVSIPSYEGAAADEVDAAVGTVAGASAGVADEANVATSVADVATSVADAPADKKRAPFGPGPRAALDAVLDIAHNLGFAVADVDGYAGYAQMRGKTDTQIGIIGHVDVVPAGPGWHFEPFAVSQKDGCLVGRGVIDDKGPTLMALHALKCLNDLDIDPAYTVRFIFGANEETGMADVAYYRARHADPAFLFTPDAEFPVCNGEKGVYHALVASAPVPQENARIMEFEGGMATNAVPGQAHARVRAERSMFPDGLPSTPHVVVTWEGEETARIDAEGVSAHASTPEKGENAIKLIVDLLLNFGWCSPEERAFLEFQHDLLGATDGSGVGLATTDDHFGALTVVGGVVKLHKGRFTQSIDVRFPTTITADEITRRVTSRIRPFGGTVEVESALEPFLIKPDAPEIQALLAAYNDVTGEGARPFTMGGATYAREFSRGASFGAEMPWIPLPAWAGDMHGPDEAVRIDQLRTAFKVYVLALYNLQQIELG